VLVLRIATLVPSIAIFALGSWSLLSALHKYHTDTGPIILHNAHGSIPIVGARDAWIEEPWPALFGELAEAEVASVATPNTREPQSASRVESLLLHGLIVNGSTSRAIFQIDGKFGLRSVGDELSSGVYLISIGWGSVTVGGAGHQVQLFLASYGNSAPETEQQPLQGVISTPYSPVDSLVMFSTDELQISPRPSDREAFLVYVDGVTDSCDQALPWREDPGFPP